MNSLGRILCGICLLVVMCAPARAQLSCNGILSCNASTPAYSFTNSGLGNGLNVTHASGKGIQVTATGATPGDGIAITQGGGKAISVSSTAGATGLDVSSAFGIGVNVSVAGATNAAFEGVSYYYHGMEIECCHNTSQLYHAVKAIQDATTGTGGYAVYGQSSRNTGVYGKALLAGQYGVYASGNLGASGTKTFVEPHPYDASKQIQYAALEGPEAGTYFRGTGKLARGIARIPVPDDFRIVSDEKGLTVHVTPIGELALVACVKKNLTELVIQGNRDVEFDYVVYGVRKAFADFQPVVENRDFVPHSPNDAVFAAGLPEESLQRLMSNGTLNEDGTVNLETASRFGWDKMASWSSPTEDTPKE